MNKYVYPYEVVMVFSLEKGEDSAKALSERFQKLISDHGEIQGEIEEWGRRKLAYPINDELEGYYMLINFNAEPEFPKELYRIANITDGCLRSLVVRKDEEIPAEA